MSTNDQNGQQKEPIAPEQGIISLGQVLQKMREDNGVDDLVKTTVSYLQENLNYPFIWIAFYNHRNKTLYGKGGLTPDRETSDLTRSIVIQSDDFLDKVVNELCPLNIVNLQDESANSEWQQIASKYNIQGTIVLPIHYRGNCLGIVLLGSQSREYLYLLTEEARAKLLIVIGELGTLLYTYRNNSHQPHNLQESFTKPLLQLLDNIRSVSDLNKRLEAVVDATHKFVLPSRTNIYWLERERNYFWCRMSNHLININSANSNKTGAAGITVPELSDVYDALSMNKVVWISETDCSLKINFQDHILQRLGVRAVLIAPIIWQKDLLGFLSVESYEPRNWVEVEQKFVEGAAGLLSLVAPNEIIEIEDQIRQTQNDTQLTNQVAQAIYREENLDSALQLCAGRILERLSGTRFVLLQYNPKQDIYEIIFQSMRYDRRLWKFSLSKLEKVDVQLLQSAKQSLEIENLAGDFRFSNWRQKLSENGARSLLICNCSPSQTPELLLLITHETKRSWKTVEKELLWVFSQNIGVVVNHWQLRDTARKQQKISQILKKFLNMLIRSKGNRNETEVAAIKQIASVLEVPLAIMLSSNPGEDWAKIVPGVISDHQFGVISNFHVSLEKDVLAELATAHNSYLILKADDLPAETRQWLIIPDRSKVFIMALRKSPECQPAGIVVLADYQERHWTKISVNAIETMIYQLAWWQSQQQIIQKLESDTENLRHLNWYKHTRIEEIHRLSTLTVRRIRDLGIPVNELGQTRYKLLLQQLDHLAGSMAGMIKQEQWDLHISIETVSVSNLLKRAIERVDNLVKQQQLWIGLHHKPYNHLGQSHNDRRLSPISSLPREQTHTSSTLAATGDMVKIELVFHELLVAACQRSPVGDRVDIWYSRLDDHSLEISIVDNGTIEPQLLAELNKPQSLDTLFVTDLNKPPGLHLVICKQMMQQLGGGLQISQLPDPKVVSRFLLPLGSHH